MMNEQTSVPQHKSWLLIAALLAAALTATVVVIIWPWLMKEPASTPEPAAIAVQESETPERAEIEQVQQELQALKNNESQAKIAADLKNLQDRLDRLEKNTVDAATVLKLMERLDSVNETVRDLQSRRKADAALILSLGLLKEAVDRGAPFDGELRALKALAPDDRDVAQAVTMLKTRAAAGIPTKAVLQARFVALDAVIVRADTMPVFQDAAPDDWRAQVIQRLLTLFTLRREDGEVSGSGVPSIVARTRAALDRGDWTQAVHELDGLTGEPAKAAQLWLSDAHARLDADHVLSDLAADAVAAAGAKL